MALLASNRCAALLRRIIPSAVDGNLSRFAGVNGQNWTRNVSSKSVAHPAHKRIDKLLKSSDKKVYVFMKGEPVEPMCRFSAIVCQIMQVYEVNFDSYNVLEDPEVREGIKTYTNWPTIPQVFINGAFVGGCDIMLQMHQNGELTQLFKDIKKREGGESDTSGDDGEAQNK